MNIITRWYRRYTRRDETLADVLAPYVVATETETEQRHQALEILARIPVRKIER